jgi:membrane-bound lytic murein transglycosylase D
LKFKSEIQAPVKQALLSILFLPGFVLLSAAEPHRNFSVTDTIIISDSAKLPNDPKKIFKDLFVNKQDTSGAAAVELNPRAASFVQDYMDRHSKRLQKMKDWALPYFNMMDGILSGQGLPNELKYLAVIESDLKPWALSWAGAVGPWQFMAATGRRMGLKINRSVDERTDYYKSTIAASKYLKELFSEYGDWLLVIAAYNGGTGNVNRAIKKSHSHNFWDLQYHLPEESRNHVKKFIATHYIMEGNGGITTVTRAEASEIDLSAINNKSLTQEEINNLKTQTITGKYLSLIISKTIFMDLADFNRYNPNFDRQVAIKASYDLRLPADKMEVFNSKKNQILEESIKLLLSPVNTEKKS